MEPIVRTRSGALRWVQEEIAGFGGDPGSVPIMGESAGALAGLPADLARPRLIGTGSARPRLRSRG
ncbi:carboxylesterase family protein [Saccharopolyspora sp. CA-218241]|uniref:carboxylesterase family protein n=1 Tax=Saccharopolyspora sp. CA-218241 TaxID=3240027 RepID=UPI003D985948